jgi:hypothetical protein
VYTLLDWDKSLKKPWIAIYISELASESFIDDGLRLMRRQLKEPRNVHGVEHFDFHSVARIVSDLL